MTKASYTALLVVPLIAGGWQAVRVVLNGTMQSTREAKRELDRSAEEFRKAVGELDERAKARMEQQAKAGGVVGRARDAAVERAVPPIQAKILEVAGRVEGRFEKLYREHGPDTWSTPLLPAGWVVGYLAAVFVALGHFLYQVRAPAEVRRTGRNGFREERNREFRQADGEERRDLVERAFPPLEAVAERLPHDRHRSLVRRNNQTIWLPGSWLELEAEERYDAEPAADDAVAQSRPRAKFSRRQYELILIDEGAAAEYDLLAHENPRSAWASLVCYAVGGGFVVWLLGMQLSGVLRSAGWMEW